MGSWFPESLFGKGSTFLLMTVVIYPELVFFFHLGRVMLTAPNNWSENVVKSLSVGRGMGLIR